MWGESTNSVCSHRHRGEAVKKLLALFPLYICVGAAFAQTHVQSCANQNVANPVGSVSCTFSNPIGAGHLLTVSITTFLSGTFSGTFSGDSGTFTAITGQQNISSGSAVTQNYYV